MAVEQAGLRVLEGGGALIGLEGAVAAVGGAVLTLLVLFFFLQEGEQIWGGALALVGEPRRDPLERLGRRPPCTATSSASPSWPPRTRR